MTARTGAPAGRWLLPVAVGSAVVLGASIGGESGVATVAVAVSMVPLVFALSVSSLACLSLAAALTYRLAAPSATGPIALIPDVLVLVVCARALAELALGRGRALPLGMKRVVWCSLALLGLTLASTVVSGDRLLAWGQSIRQFLRFPIWALAVTAAGIGVDDARRLVKVLLAASLLQLPIALHQFTHPIAGTALHGVRFFQGDNVSGTFGFGGSSTAMIFLVICSMVWLPLVFERVVPAWLLWILAPFLVVPMALGSASSYVLLLPIGILALMFLALQSRRFRLTAAGVWTGGLLLVVSLWAAGHLALAPGFAGSEQPSGTALLSQSYLSRYLSETGGSSQPGSRLGFLRFSIGSDLRAGWTGVALGHGPSLAILDRSGPSRLEGERGNHSALATRSVQSLQRLLIGFGFVVPGVFLLMILLPVAGLRRARSPDAVIRAVLLALPVAALIYALAGVYNAPWSDPGVSAAFWALAVAAYAGTSEEPHDEEAFPSAQRNGYVFPRGTEGERV